LDWLDCYWGGYLLMVISSEVYTFIWSIFFFFLYSFFVVHLGIDIDWVYIWNVIWFMMRRDLYLFLNIYLFLCFFNIVFGGDCNWSWTFNLCIVLECRLRFLITFLAYSPVAVSQGHDGSELNNVYLFVFIDLYYSCVL